ncbi:hypothetical protein H9Q73_012563, partial [Fusarium xylarioides]
SFPEKLIKRVPVRTTATMSSSLRTPTPRPAAGSRITIEAITNGRAADEDPFADDDDDLPSPGCPGAVSEPSL